MTYEEPRKCKPPKVKRQPSEMNSKITRYRISKDFKEAIVTTHNEGQKNTLRVDKNAATRHRKKHPNGNSRTEK